MGTPVRALIGIPYYESVRGNCINSWSIACKPPNSFSLQLSAGGFLTYNFNWLWCLALNNRLTCSKCSWKGSTRDKLCFKCGGPTEHNLTHFCMIHADVEPLTHNWLDAMIEELELAKAGVLSIVLPIKSLEGLTSTAIENELGMIRRFTMTDILDIKELTFDANSAGFPNHRLLISSGLWVADFQQEWVHDTTLAFRLEDGIEQLEDGSFKPVMLPEDWQFSRRVQDRGVRVVASTCVEANHWGISPFANNYPWGSIEREEFFTAWKGD